jgi:AcrR family transcriptional regulator
MRAELHEQRRNKILQAARQVFLDRGFDRAPVDAIAKAARVSTGTVYIYFPTKDELFEAATDLALAPYEGLFDDIDHMTGGPEAVLTRFGEVYFQFLAEPEVQSIYRIVGMEAARRSVMAGRIHATAHRLLGTVLRRQLARFHDSGELDVPDPAIPARLFQGMIEHSSLTIPLLSGASLPLHPADVYCAEAVRVFLAAYRPR